MKGLGRQNCRNWERGGGQVGEIGSFLFEIQFECEFWAFLVEKQREGGKIGARPRYRGAGRGAGIARSSIAGLSAA